MSIDSYEIKTAKFEDEIMGIAGCAYITWHDTYDNLLPDGQVDYMIKKYQSFDAIKRDISENGYIYYAVISGTKVIAFCGVKPENEKLFISKIYVMPKYQRCGIASEIFEKLLVDFKDKYNIFYLTVNKNNEKAISAYKSFGFEIKKSITTDIGNGYVMDDYIMEFKIV